MAGLDHVQVTSFDGNSTAPAATFGVAPTQGNTLIAWVTADNAGNNLAAAGSWAKLTTVSNGNSKMAFFWKVAGASEGAAQQPASMTSGQWTCSIVEKEGGAALQAEVGDTPSSSLTPVSNAADPADGIRILVVGGAWIGAVGRTWSGQAVNGSATGVNERTDLFGGNGLAGSATLFDKVEAASSAGTYTAQATASGTAIASACCLAIFSIPTVTFPAEAAAGTAQGLVATLAGGATFAAGLAGGTALAPAGALAAGGLFAAASAAGSADAAAADLSTSFENQLLARVAEAAAGALAAVIRGGAALAAATAAGAADASLAAFGAGGVLAAEPAAAIGSGLNANFAQSGVLEAPLADGVGTAYPAGAYAFGLRGYARALETPPQGAPQVGRWLDLGEAALRGVVPSAPTDGGHHLSGPLAGRPVGGLQEGDIYVATDTDEAFVWVVEGA